MKFHIKSERDGLFVGEFLGLGFFEANKETGDISPNEKPVEFESRKQAQDFLDSWIGGKSDCYVVEVL